MVNITVGIPAYNEEKNIGKLLQDIQNQKLPLNIKLTDVVIVDDGSTDNTVNIAKSFQTKLPNLRIISKARREGMTSAINTVFKVAKGEIVILVAADTRLASDAILQLITPLKCPLVGATVGKTIPLNNPRNFWGFVAHNYHKLWGRLPNLITVDVGALSAIRRDIFEPIPSDIVLGDRFIELYIRKKGYKIVYVPSARVYMKGAENLRDLVNQRRRTLFGFLQLKRKGVPVGDLNLSTRIIYLRKNFSWNPKKMFWMLCYHFLCLYAYIMAYLDFIGHKSHTCWKIATSTKMLNEHHS
jgi:cellulose synthase/poly-beta-1,6-N-acetylglucosamine synthase-like glycosyltransferase